MRAIRKQASGGYHLTRAHKNPPGTGAQAASRWASFGHKPEVMACLQAEQYGLCAYSELRADEEGLGYHIEHVENKSQHPQRTFDYANLAASALDSENDLKVFSVSSEDVFGGHASGKSGRRGFVDMERFVSPHQPDCKKYFAYLSDGRVTPQGDLSSHDEACARYTIDMLNLNSPFLVTRRRQWWDELSGLYDEHEARCWNVTELAAMELVPLAGQVSRFFTLTRQFFKVSAEEALRRYAPELL